MNRFLQRFAMANQANDSTRTFVVLNESRVAGFYSLAASAIQFEEAPPRMSMGLARHPVPIILMARFAVDLQYEGRGLGSALFKDAIMRTLNVSQHVGARAFVVHIKDDDARLLYEHFGMAGFPHNPFHLFHLFHLMKDIERALALR